MGGASSLVLAALGAVLMASPGRATEAVLIPTRGETFEMIEAKEWGRLEKITAALRDARIGFYNGWPPIHRFYGELAFETRDDTVWTKYTGLYSDWAGAFPESPTPRVALAKLYVSYAWQARGSGWSDSVTPEGWRLFNERLTKAQGVLAKAKALKVQDAEAYLTSIVVDRGLGLPREQVDDDAKQGLAINPDYTPIYAAEADYLLPKWYGKAGEWETYATDAADERGGEDGDVLYMFIVREAARDFGAELFSDHLVSYPRMRRGFLVSRSRFPTNAFDLNSFCYFASIAGDTETAAGLFREIGTAYTAEVWGDSKTFEYWQSRALNGNVRPGLWERNAKTLEFCGLVLVLLLAGLLILLRKASNPTPPLLPEAG
jgi:hypothetical protein